MPSVLLLVVAAVTSVTAGLAMRRSGSPVRGLGAAVRQVLELAGFAALFLLANLALGLAIVLGIRSVSSLFVSVYVLDDVSLVALSVLQGAVFFCWRTAGRRAPRVKASHSSDHSPGIPGGFDGK